MKIRVTPRLHQNGESIILRTELIRDDHDPFIDAVQCLNEAVLNTQDEAVRQALIALGWTPPKEREFI